MTERLQLDLLDNQPLRQAILAQLQAQPEGISEFDLLHLLRAEPEGAHTRLFPDALTLFRLHFLLFHALYVLRDELHAAGRAHLEINAVRIRLLPYVDAPAQALADTDPLRDYYLDLERLASTREEDVEQLLGSFWRRFVTLNERIQALEELGLPADADEPAIKTRYRNLALEHHPDRGGDAQRLQSINAAMDKLRSARKKRT